MSNEPRGAGPRADPRLDPRGGGESARRFHEDRPAAVESCPALLNRDGRRPAGRARRPRAGRSARLPDPGRLPEAIRLGTAHMPDNLRVLELLEEALQSGRSPEDVCADCPDLRAEVRRCPRGARPGRAGRDVPSPGFDRGRLDRSSTTRRRHARDPRPRGRPVVGGRASRSRSARPWSLVGPHRNGCHPAEVTVPTLLFW